MAQLLGIGKKGKLVDTTSGAIGDGVQGIGFGTIVNVTDKRFLQGKLTAMGITLTTTTIGGVAKPVCFNVTDALTWGAVAGIKNPLKKASLISGLIAVGSKKIFELLGYIDPPMPTSGPYAPNTNSLYVAPSPAVAISPIMRV